MNRHIREYCKVANSEEGMEKLMEHTIQKQLATQNAKIDELTALVKQMVQINGAAPPASEAPPHKIMTPTNRSRAPAPRVAAPTNNTVQIINQVNHVQQTVNYLPGLRSFDSEDRLIIPAALVKAAFTENPRLAAYCKLSDEEKTDAEAAAPYVLEALMELVKRAHKDPLSRNVYLNPKRADQALVFVDSDDVKTWEVRPLLEAIRRIFDTVAGGIHRVIVTDAERAQLPFDVQSSASWIPNLYDDEPDKYVKEAKQPMSAHLTNTRPLLEHKVAAQLTC
jgi:hypothetical protein